MPLSPHSSSDNAGMFIFFYGIKSLCHLNYKDHNVWLYVFFKGCTSANLTDQDLNKVLEEVLEAKAKWKFIGLRLGVSIGELDAIESMGSNIDVKLLRTLAKWLQSGKKVTWKALAESMGEKSVGREDLKLKLFEKYCCS